MEIILLKMFVVVLLRNIKLFERKPILYSVKLKYVCTCTCTILKSIPVGSRYRDEECFRGYLKRTWESSERFRQIGNKRLVRFIVLASLNAHLLEPIQ